MPSLSLLAKSGASQAWFKLSDASPALANALRRSILADLPSMAVDEVHLYENTSPFYNEYVAHRVGLVPLTWEDGVADDARVAFALEAEGPKTVLSGELKSADEKIKVFNPDLPLCKLGEGQRLRLEAYAGKGTARKHARYQCAHASYTAWCDLKAEKSAKAAQEAVKEILPKAVFKDKDSLVLENAHQLDVPSVADLLEKKGVSVKAKDDAFLFYVESYNDVPAVRQAQRGLERLIGHVAEVAEVDV